MTFILPIIFIFLLIPYMGWGIYILRLQLKYREELEASVKWATVAGVIAFHFLQLSILRRWMGTDSGDYLFTTLGLMLSSVALYGHLVMSIASQIAVDMIHPPDEHESDTPDFAPAEALEEIGDYEGALNEYMVIGRIFPKDPDPLLRLADTYMHLGETEKALVYFSKGLNCVGFPERALRITNRMYGIYANTLDNSEEAKAVLHDFLQRFGDTEEGESVRKRLEIFDKPKEEVTFQSVTGMLEPPPSDLLE